MVPKEIEIYDSENTQVGLEVHYFDEGVPANYWVKSGVASIACTEEELRELSDLVGSFVAEELTPNVHKPIMKSATLVFVALIAFALGGILFNV